MSQAEDPALYGDSGFERIPKDRYWTEPSVTAALMRRLPVISGSIIEPAAGRGDLARVLIDHGHDVFASDIDLTEFDFGLCPWKQINFLAEDLPNEWLIDADAIITNPPYDHAEDFLRRALSYESIRYVAMVLRAEFKNAVTRKDLFGECPMYAAEVVLTWRPRWDWWFREKPKAGPRHQFSWFLWDRQHTGAPDQFFEGRHTTNA